MVLSFVLEGHPVPPCPRWGKYKHSTYDLNIRHLSRKVGIIETLFGHLSLSDVLGDKVAQGVTLAMKHRQLQYDGRIWRLTGTASPVLLRENAEGHGRSSYHFCSKINGKQHGFSHMFLRHMSRQGGVEIDGSVVTRVSAHLRSLRGLWIAACGERGSTLEVMAIL